MSELAKRSDETVVTEMTFRLFVTPESMIGEDDLFDLRDNLATALEAAATGVHSEAKRLMPSHGWRAAWEVSP